MKKRSASFTLTGILASSLLLSSVFSSSVFAKELPTTQLEWMQSYGTKSFDEYGISFKEVKDGGFIAAAVKVEGDAFNPLPAIYLTRIDKDGKKLWENTFAQNQYMVVTDVTQTKDGGFLVLGFNDYPITHESHIHLLKIDKNGNFLWDHQLPTANNASARTVMETKDGNFMLAGSITTDDGSLDAFIVKTDPEGTPIWSRQFGGIGVDFFNDMQETKDGGYIATGKTYSVPLGNQSNVYLVKLDKDGNKTWDANYGGYDEEWGNNVEQTKDGGYIISGGDNSYDDVGYSHVPREHGYMIKTDAVGNLQWEQRLHATLKWITQTKDGSYIGTGSVEVPNTLPSPKVNSSLAENPSIAPPPKPPTTNADVNIIHFDSTGNVTSEQQFGGPENGMDYGTRLVKFNNGDIAVLGTTNSFTHTNDILVMKLSTY